MFDILQLEEKYKRQDKLLKTFLRVLRLVRVRQVQKTVDKMMY